MNNRPDNRIVVRLLDGLGNQLFQYALGRRLAIDRGADLHFDTGWFRQPRAGGPDGPLRPLAIREFHVVGQFSPEPLWSEAWLRPSLLGKIRWRIEQRMLPPNWRSFIQEDPNQMCRRGWSFDARILRVRRNAYLFGWLISPLYFSEIENVLRDELVLKDLSNPELKKYLERIGDCESVSVHVRRGDFLKHPNIGVLDREYYARALTTIRSRVENPVFFVFSDDVSEARKLLQGLGEFEYVTLGPAASPAYDLWLMAACKNFINANSTFSWWGAWLSRHAEKIVLVPDKWYVGLNVGVSDIYPPAWVRLPTI